MGLNRCDITIEVKQYLGNYSASFYSSVKALVHSIRSSENTIKMCFTLIKYLLVYSISLRPILKDMTINIKNSTLNTRVFYEKHKNNSHDYVIVHFEGSEIAIMTDILKVINRELHGD